MFVGVLGFAYFLLITMPALHGESTIVGVLGDSFNYHAIAETASFKEMVTHTLAPLYAGDYGFANFGLFGISSAGWLARKIFGNQYELVIFVVNYILLLLTIKNYSRVFYGLDGRSYRFFLVLLLCNPAICPNLGSLNKEIWGLFFVSSFLKNVFLRKYFRFFVAAIASLMFRDAYFYVAILFLFMNWLSRNSIIVLIGVSLLLPVLLPNPVGNTAADLGARSTFMFMRMQEIEKHALGYLLTYMPKLAIQFFTGMYPARLADMATNNPYGASLTLSSTAFFISFLVLGYRRVTQRYRPELIVLRMFFAYTFVFCIIPYSAHRLFIPLYPVVAMMAVLGATRKLVKTNNA
jgi:hypothetical protein